MSAIAPLASPRIIRWLSCAMLVTLVLASTARGVVSNIRPLDFGNGVVVAGTITTIDGTATITDWNLTVTTTERLGHYTRSNTGAMTVSQVSVSADGQRLTVATSPDGVDDGGTLLFRAPNPFVDVGTAIADFSSTSTWYSSGGLAFYMNGGVFDFLDLNQPLNSDYLAATASPLGGNRFDLVPLSFSGGVVLSGTITTDGTTGPLTAGHLQTWDIVVDQMTRDLFNPGNSTLSASLLGLGPDGQTLEVTNPDGSLLFIKGYGGGHLYGLKLADFSDQAPPGGEAGYYQGRLGFQTLDLHADRGPWAVTGSERISRPVPEPTTAGLAMMAAGGLVLRRLRRRG